jgi:syntaxin-binding protein 1
VRFLAMKDFPAFADASNLEGSSHVVTGKRFVEDLKVLDMEGIGSIAAANGLPNVENSRGEPRSYQLAYDKKYFITDAPRPEPRPAPPSSTNSSGRPRPPPSPNPAASNLSLHGEKDSVPKKEKEKKKRGLFHF